MRIKHILVIALILLIAIPAYASVVSQQRPKIFIVGDSHASYAPWAYSRLAVCGASAQWLAAAVHADVEPPDDYDIVIVFAGTANIFAGQTEQQVWDAIDGLIDEIKEHIPSANIIVVSPYKTRAIAHSGKCLADGEHMNEAGYEQVWKECIWPNLSLKAAE